MAQTSMGGRSVWWRIVHADGDPTLAAAPDLVVVAAPAVGAVEATEAGAPGAAPDPTPGLVPVATRDVIVPAPGLEESPALSQEEASPALATAGPALDPTNPNLVHGLASPDPIQLSVNLSPDQRAVPR